MMHGLSDYTLPEAEVGQARLARSLGLPSPSEYRATLETHLSAVQAIYGDVFSQDGEDGGWSLGALCEAQLGDAEAAAGLRELGFSRPAEAHRNLILLAYGHAPRMRGARAHQSFMALAPALMRTLQASSDSDQGLGNLVMELYRNAAPFTLFNQRQFRSQRLKLHLVVKNLFLHTLTHQSLHKGYG